MRHSSLRVLFAVFLGVVLAAPALFAQSSAGAAQTASQTYLAYRAAFEKAKTIQEILPFMSAARLKQMEDTPEAERAEMFEMIKMLDTAKSVKVLREVRTPTGATLTVEGTDEGSKATATVTMVREGDAWKLDKESWKSGS